MLRRDAERRLVLTSSFPRISFAHLPTPLEEMPRLTKTLDGPRLLIKRDDQTGLAIGGNKTRKLEFSIAEALRRNADTVVTVGAAQSNHCRQAAAATARCGLRCILVLRGDEPAEWNGNLLLDHLLGAQVRFSGARDRAEVAAQVMQEEQAAGRRPFFIPLGASDEFGAMGYVAAMEELAEQLRERQMRADRIVFASSSAGTQAGLCAGAKALSLKSQLAAIAIDSTRAELQADVAAIAIPTLRRLGLAIPFSAEDVSVYDGYLGAGYGIMGAPEKEAIELTARTEGILLDPVYTGRAMAGLIDLIHQGEFGKHETIIFWHTGGAPALFAYAQQFKH
ncbi:MAG: D-cysteine desulfhydrase family protein [Chloroflexi bacterium]|nr:D-cysteine desulfhydrase family protein [Chloroflexota bacterium]